MRLYWIPVIFVCYFIVINVVAGVLVSDLSTQSFSGASTSDSETQKIGVADAVDVDVTRPRWYGTIVETFGDKPSSNLHVLGFLTLPLKANGFDFVPIHFVFPIVTILAVFILFPTQKASSALDTKPKGRDTT